MNTIRTRLVAIPIVGCSSLFGGCASAPSGGEWRIGREMWAIEPDGCAAPVPPDGIAMRPPMPR